MTTNSEFRVTSEEIDLKELFAVLWRGKWIILVSTLIFSALAITFAIKQPNYYKAEVLLSPNSGEGTAGSVGQLGGLAALAGVNIAKGDDKTQLAIAVLQSRDFLSSFIIKHKVKEPLFAGLEWDAKNRYLQLDPEIYDEAEKRWTRKAKEGKEAEPSTWESYKEFRPIVKVIQDQENNLVTVSVEFLSPVLVKYWVENLVIDLNSVMKLRELEDTDKNIKYLEQQLDKTNVADMQSVFYQLIEEQIKKRMLAEVQDEYIFKVVDPAVEPEEKSKPKRTLIAVAGIMLGGVFGVLFVLVSFFLRKNNTVS